MRSVQQENLFLLHCLSSTSKEEEKRIFSFDAPGDVLAAIVNLSRDKNISFVRERRTSEKGKDGEPFLVLMLDKAVEDVPHDWDCLKQLQTHRQMKSLMGFLRPDHSEHGIFREGSVDTSDILYSREFHPDMLYKFIRRKG